jgi:hypothetical protein
LPSTVIDADSLPYNYCYTALCADVQAYEDVTSASLKLTKGREYGYDSTDKEKEGITIDEHITIPKELLPEGDVSIDVHTIVTGTKDPAAAAAAAAAAANAVGSSSTAAAGAAKGGKKK